MNIRNTTLAALVAALLFATGGSSQANYTLTEVSLTPLSVTFGGTTFTLQPSGGGVQTANAASNFNVVDIGVVSTTAPPAFDTGNTTVTEMFTLTGTQGTESFTMTGTLNLLSGSSGGVVTTFTNTMVNITSGSGYAVSFNNYGAPSVGSTVGGSTDGEIGITVTPNSVPEPASVAMMGLGLVGVAGVGLRRRMAK